MQICRSSFLILVVFLVSVSAVSISAQRKKSKPRIPVIGLNKIAKDVVGKRVYQIPSAGLTGNNMPWWEFAKDEFRTIKVLENKFNKETASIVITMDTADIKPNANGMFYKLKGDLRLLYERESSGWTLTEIENLTFKYIEYGSNTGGANISETPTYKPSPTIQYLVSGAFTIGAGKYQWHTFTVANRAIVSGRFTAQGGGGNDIEVYILDQDAFTNWTNNHQVNTYYNSRRVTVDNVNANLGPGIYYLIFNNNYSFITPKAISANIIVTYYP